MSQWEEVRQTEVPMLQLLGSGKASQITQTRWRKLSEKRKSNSNKGSNWAVVKKDGDKKKIIQTNDQMISDMYAWHTQKVW